MKDESLDEKDELPELTIEDSQNKKIIKTFLKTASKLTARCKSEGRYSLQESLIDLTK